MAPSCGFRSSPRALGSRLAALATLLVSAIAAGNEPVERRGQPAPAPLRCLEKFYKVTPVSRSGAWYAELPDGTAIPFDDGREKTTDERLAAPDVKDVFFEPYPTGKIVPNTTEDLDPGRIRIERLFTATYGASEREVVQALVAIDFLGHGLRVHRRAARAFGLVAERLGRAVRRDPSIGRFLRGLGGTFNWRNVAGTTNRSLHSFGIAIDLNVELSNYWQWERPPLKWKNRYPQAIVDAFEAEGFAWGGRWYHFDTMHFEYRPELLEPSCGPGARPFPAREREDGASTPR